MSCAAGLFGQKFASPYATYIATTPPGARVYINGEYIGDSPISYQDDPGSVPKDFYIVISKEGYRTIVARVEREWGRVESSLEFNYRLRKNYSFKLKPEGVGAD